MKQDDYPLLFSNWEQTSHSKWFLIDLIQQMSLSCNTLTNVENLNPTILEYCALAFAILIILIFRESLENRQLPLQISYANVTPLHKKDMTWKILANISKYHVRCHKNRNIFFHINSIYYPSNNMGLSKTSIVS